MSVKVKPVQVKKMQLQYVPDGAIFTMNGNKYIKLENNHQCAESERGTYDYFHVVAMSIKPFGKIQSTPRSKRDTMGDRVTAAILSARFDDDTSWREIVNLDLYNKYGHLMTPHIRGEWFVDCYIDKLDNKGDYLYADDSCNLCVGNEFDDLVGGKARMLDVRAVCDIEPYVVVTVERSDMTNSIRQRMHDSSEFAANLLEEMQ